MREQSGDTDSQGREREAQQEAGRVVELDRLMLALEMALGEYTEARLKAGGPVETKGLVKGLNVRIRRVKGVLRIDVRGAEGPEFTSKKLPAVE